MRHHSSDADVQLELVRATAAVALLPALTLPAVDPALAYRDVLEQRLGRRLVMVTRDGSPTPALTAFLAVVTDQARALDLLPAQRPAASHSARSTPWTTLS